MTQTEKIKKMLKKGYSLIKDEEYQFDSNKRKIILHKEEFGEVGFMVEKHEYEKELEVILRYEK